MPGGISPLSSIARSREYTSRVLLTGGLCVIGAVGFLRRPENRVVWWLVGFGAAFGAEVALGDVFLPMAEQHWGYGAPVTVLAALVCQWAGVAISVAIIGMFGLFPSGRPERALTASSSGRQRLWPCWRRCWTRSAAPISR